MSTLSPRPLLPAFLPSLNALLVALGLPFTLNHPTDLTPSLLLAIFESLICARLPIPSSVRQSRTRDAKARAMLVLLGVLECDVLRGGTAADAEHSIAASNADDSMLGGAGGVSVDGWVDEIGLGEVDPERLADGGWEETIFVGELLCWLARRKGVLPRTKSSHRPSHPRSLYSNHHSYGTEGDGDTPDLSTSLLLQPSSSQKSRSLRSPSPVNEIDADVDASAFSHITDVPRHPLVHSPEPSVSASTATGTDFSIRARSVSSRTSVPNTHEDPEEFDEASQDTIRIYDPRQMMQDAEEDDDRPPTFRPQCIHELEDPSYIHTLAGPSSSFDPSASQDYVSADDSDPSRDYADGTDEQDADDPYEPPTPTPRRVRLTGWIEPVDATTELNQFAASRAHSRSHAFNVSGGFSSGSPSGSQSRSHKSAHTGESMSRLNTERSPHPGSGKPSTRALRPVSPSSPPSPPPTSSNRPPTRPFPSPPPSPSTDSDEPFDISFSTLNNTSTPAKPRLSRHHHSQTMSGTRVDKGKSEGSGATAIQIARPPPRRRDRSPTYTPSPPSFSNPSTIRSAGGTPSTRVVPNESSVPGTRPAPPSTSSMAKGRGSNRRSTSPTPMTNTKGRSPPGSTATTNTLLTERARLLTELAALKRARAASGAAMGMGTGSSDRNGVVDRRVGLGV